MRKNIVQFAFFLILFIPLLTPQVFGHGLGGDQAPPISFGGMDVTVFTQLTPSDLTVGQVDKANMGIRFFDLLTDQNLDEVTYRVEIWRSDELLARELFYDSQGQLDVEIRPDSDCNETEKIHCTKYFGEREQISNGLMQRGSQPPVIDGPIFDKGGLYNIRVDIEGASSPRTLVSEPLSFDTFVSVAHEQDFFISTAQAQEIPVVLKTYYDDVENFSYDSTKDSISFDMLFNWKPDYVDLVKVVHEEIRVPKTFEPYSDNIQFDGYVNGVKLSDRAVLSDPYSSEEQNIIHFLVTGNELKQINEEIGSENYDEGKMSFVLIPEKENQRNSVNIELETGITATIEWNEKDSENSEIPFDFTFFDSSGNLIKDVRYGFTISDDTGKVLITNTGTDQNNPGIVASEGLDTQKIPISHEGQYSIEVAVFGSGIGAKTDLSIAGLGTGAIDISPHENFDDTIQSEKTAIPDWIRNNAGWWANNQLSDEEFVSGIQFLIKNRIIQIPVSAQNSDSIPSEIPSWIKQNAGWWADGAIDDDAFIQGVEFLIKNNILLV